MAMENAIMEKRIGKCEDKISELSKEVTENTVNMSHFQKIVEKFEKFTDECTKTLIEIQNSIKNLNEKHDSLEKKLCEIEDKVENNEESHKVDTRPIIKNIISKVITGLLIAGLGIGLLISLLS
jgi:septal ring factor EnvC (AmiA/AmiB activator)